MCVWLLCGQNEKERKTPNKKLRTTTAGIITATFIVLIVPFFSLSLNIDSLQLLCYLVVSLIRNLAILIAFFISSHNVQHDEHVNDDTVPYICTRIMCARVCVCVMCTLYMCIQMANVWHILHPMNCRMMNST